MLNCKTKLQQFTRVLAKYRSLPIGCLTLHRVHDRLCNLVKLLLQLYNLLLQPGVLSTFISQLGTLLSLPQSLLQQPNLLLRTTAIGWRKKQILGVLSVLFILKYGGRHQNITLLWMLCLGFNSEAGHSH